MISPAVARTNKVCKYDFVFGSPDTVLSGGNCQFRSLCKQMTGDQLKHTYTVIAENLPLFTTDWMACNFSMKDHIARVAKKGEWGSHTEMKSTKVQNPRRKCSAVVETNCLVAKYRIPYRIRPRTIITHAHHAPLIDGLGHAMWSAT